MEARLDIRFDVCITYWITLCNEAWSTDPDLIWINEGIQD